MIATRTPGRSSLRALATACGIAAALLLGGAVQAAWVTMVDNGPSSNRVDIVILGDGYTASQIDSVYPTHIQAMLNHMFSQAEDPYPRYSKFFNVHRIDVVSAESGADVPPLGIYRNTALDASYYWDGSTERLLYVNTTKAISALSAGLSGASFSAEMKLVTINDTRYGGGGGTFAAYAGGNSSAPEIAMHELGHSFSGLADEYGGYTTTYPYGEPSEVNVTKDSTGAKWSRWLGYVDPVHPSMGAIGAYEGAVYYNLGVYRPSQSSKMRALGQPFDAVSREKIILDIYKYVHPLDSYRDNGAALNNAGFLWSKPIDANVIKAEWSVNGEVVSGATATFFNPLLLAPGSYTVTLRAYDGSSDWVRAGSSNMQQSVSWSVTVSAAVLAWDGSTGTAGLQDGGGNWDTTSANRWYNPATSAYHAWSNAAPRWAVFGYGSDAAGSVALSGPITVGNITFNPAKSGTYTVAGSTLTLSGTPTIDVNADATISSVLAGDGFTKSGGSTLTLSGANTYTGTTTLGAGTLTVGASNVIPSGVGKGDVVIDGGPATAGTFNLNGFDLTINGLSGVAGAVLGQVVNNASGTSKTLTLGAGDATASFAGVIKDNNNAGTGTLRVAKTGTGTQTLSGLNTYTGNTTVSAGKLVVTQGINNGGIASPAGSTTVAAGAELEAKNIRQAGLTLDGKATILASGVADQTVSVVSSALAVNASTGLLNLQDNDLILKAATGQTEDSIKTLIAAGYNTTQDWTGTTGLTSTTAAAANPTYFGLGYGLVSKTLGPSATTFDGQPVAQDDLIVKYTYKADLNLDGVVNGNDVIAFAAGYGKGSNWSDGNITYHDGPANGNDVIAFAAAYNSSLGAVPEPGVLVLLALAGVGVLLFRCRFAARC